MVLNKQTVLVTGGAGFIGSHMVDALIKESYSVAVVDNFSSGSEKNVHPNARIYKTDIREEALAEVFEKERPEYVFHFAAQISVNRSVEDPLFDADVNILGGLNVLELCLQNKVKKILFSSTGGALYGEAEVVPTPEKYPCEPLSPYGLAKLALEKYIRFYRRQFGLEFAIMRYANVYGPRQNPKGEAGVISIFAEKMLDNLTPIIHGDGHQTRDYVYVGDIVRANMAAFQSERSGTYNVGTAKQTTVNELFKLIKDELHSPLTPKHAEVFSGQAVSCLSYEKIKRELNWEPQTSIEQGIKKTIDWVRERKEE